MSRPGFLFGLGRLQLIHPAVAMLAFSSIIILCAGISGKTVENPRSYSVSALLHPAQFRMAAAAEKKDISKDDLPIDEKLFKIVRSSKTAEIAYFPDITTMGFRRSVQSVGASAGVNLTGDNFKRLQLLISSPETYEPIGALEKVCPFTPTIGFRFGAGNDEVWWLVSEPCKSGMLARKSDDWRRTKSVDIKPAALDAFNQLAGK